MVLFTFNEVVLSVVEVMLTGVVGEGGSEVNW